MYCVTWSRSYLVFSLGTSHVPSNGLGSWSRPPRPPHVRGKDILDIGAGINPLPLAFARHAEADFAFHQLVDRVDEVTEVVPTLEIKRPRVLDLSLASIGFGTVSKMTHDACGIRDAGVGFSSRPRN